MHSCHAGLTCKSGILWSTASWCGRDNFGHNLKGVLGDDIDLNMFKGFESRKQ